MEKLAPLVYRMSHGDKSVMFELDDLSNVKPPGAFGPDKVYLGPIFERSRSGSSSSSTAVKLYAYVLDETSRWPTMPSPP